MKIIFYLLPLLVLLSCSQNQKADNLSIEVISINLDKKENKEMSFYAKQLDITPKYLSKVIKDVSGRSAKDWIVEYTLLEIKSLLNNTTLNIQQITLDTHFSTQASLGRFFK